MQIIWQQLTDSLVWRQEKILGPPDALCHLHVDVYKLPACTLKSSPSMSPHFVDKRLPSLGSMPATIGLVAPNIFTVSLHRVIPIPAMTNKIETYRLRFTLCFRFRSI